MARLADLRREILEARGIEVVKRQQGFKRLQRPPLTLNEQRKTTHMKLVEAECGMAIEMVLRLGSCRQVAEWLGNRKIKVDYSTISKWKKWLKVENKSIPED